jgi:hypothetical protein
MVLAFITIKSPSGDGAPPLAIATGPNFVDAALNATNAAELRAKFAFSSIRPYRRNVAASSTWVEYAN